MFFPLTEMKMDPNFSGATSKAVQSPNWLWTIEKTEQSFLPFYTEQCSLKKQWVWQILHFLTAQTISPVVQKQEYFVEESWIFPGKLATIDSVLQVSTHFCKQFNLEYIQSIYQGSLFLPHPYIVQFSQWNLPHPQISLK